MSKEIDDGGPAFPTIETLYDQETKKWSGPEGLCGMSLLDWFAGMAMNGWAAGRNANSEPSTPEYVARSSYGYANAMLNERRRWIEAKPVNEPPARSALEMGREAAMAGFPPEHNPFSKLVGGEWQAWDCGWTQASISIANQART